MPEVSCLRRRPRSLLRRADFQLMGVSPTRSCVNGSGRQKDYETRVRRGRLQKRNASRDDDPPVLTTCLCEEKTEGGEWGRARQPPTKNERPEVVRPTDESYPVSYSFPSRHWKWTRPDLCKYFGFSNPCLTYLHSTYLSGVLLDGPVLRPQERFRIKSFPPGS